MRALSILVALLVAGLVSLAAPLTIEDVSPHLSTNAQIIWEAPTNSLPKSLWVYRILPNTFNAQQVSNAVVLASLQSKGIPKPTTNQVVLWDRNREKGDDPLAGSLAILPDWGQICFTIRNHALGSSNDIPDDETIVRRSWECASNLGFAHVELTQGALENTECEYDSKGGLAPANNVGGRCIALVRRIDGVDFQEESEGFTIEFGSHGVIRSFSVNWPNLQRLENVQTFSPSQMIDFIRACKAPVFPNKDEETYLSRVKSLSRAGSLTITKITPHYGEGVFGEAPKDQDRPEYATPYAEVEAIASFGDSNAPVRLALPFTFFHLQKP